MPPVILVTHCPSLTLEEVVEEGKGGGAPREEDSCRWYETLSKNWWRQLFSKYSYGPLDYVEHYHFPQLLSVSLSVSAQNIIIFLWQTIIFPTSNSLCNISQTFGISLIFTNIDMRFWYMYINIIVLEDSTATGEGFVEDKCNGKQEDDDYEYHDDDDFYRPLLVLLRLFQLFHTFCHLVRHLLQVVVNSV